MLDLHGRVAGQLSLVELRDDISDVQSVSDQEEDWLARVRVLVRLLNKILDVVEATYPGFAWLVRAIRLLFGSPFLGGVGVLSTSHEAGLLRLVHGPSWILLVSCSCVGLGSLVPSTLRISRA
jgi:hypothetical protein